MSQDIADDPFATVKEDFESDSGAHSDRESDDNIFDVPSTPLLKPVYVPMTARKTQLEKIEEEVSKAQEKKREEERKKQEAQEQIIDTVRIIKEEEQNANEKEEDIPNDDDEVDKEREYELWKIRELKRIKRDQEEEEKEVREQEEIMRRRAMTNEQRAKEDRESGKYDKPEKSHYTFMQKSYKMGVFNIDESDPIFQRDYNIAVGEDNFDKSFLPKVLQKRRGDFGRKGQSKYTHLTDQDTTDFNPAHKVWDPVYQATLGKMAGYKNANSFDKPRK